MSKDKNYQKLMNAKRWKCLRQQYLQEHPLCEICKEKGIITSAIDVHHKRPIETAHTIEDMAALAYDPANLQALCIPCHIKVHQELRSHSVEVHQQRQRASVDRWLARHKKS